MDQMQLSQNKNSLPDFDNIQHDQYVKSNEYSDDFYIVKTKDKSTSTHVDNLDNDVQETYGTGLASKSLNIFQRKTIKDLILENLNISGIKQILSTKNMIRRLVWVMVILSMIIWLIINLISRITTFTEVPRSVNIQVNYSKKLEFPAVIVCNYNTFR